MIPPSALNKRRLNALCRRPKKQNYRPMLLSSLGVFAMCLFALLCFMPVASARANSREEDYGHVIGIGKIIMFLTEHLGRVLTLKCFRFGNYVLLCRVGNPQNTILVSRLTLFSLRSVIQSNGRVEIIANDQGNRITPSWVSFTDTERLYVYHHR